MWLGGRGRQTVRMDADRRLPLAVGLDVFAVVLFVALGRRSHDEDGAFVEVLKTALPFLIGLGAGWVASRTWRAPLALATGLVVWPVTVIVGMIVRRWVFDRGTAASFVVVATLFLGLFLVGWRLAAGWWLRRRARAAVAAQVGSIGERVER